ncbi:MAG: hypothetical protein P4L98_21625, partial [Ancalomicrobiaceae bacterium]|nr:hypothetical protein [Ancalomicrobiaceae bacterium]
MKMVATLVAALIAGCLAPRAMAATGPTPPDLLSAPIMRFAIVRSASANCEPDCAEWISAEGRIDAASPADFRKLLKGLGGRKLPMFISSQGGSLEAAIAIGRIVREHHLDVAVTRTLFVGCGPADGACYKRLGQKGYSGIPLSGTAYCASACPMILAGGERRFVVPPGHIGLHEITLIAAEIQRRFKVWSKEEDGRKVEVDRKLVSEKLVYKDPTHPGANSAIYRKEIGNYLTEMGIGAGIIDIMLSAPATSIRWMTTRELRQTRLVTDEAAGETLVADSHPPFEMPAGLGPRPLSGLKSPTIPLFAKLPPGLAPIAPRATLPLPTATDRVAPTASTVFVSSPAPVVQPPPVVQAGPAGMPLVRPGRPETPVAPPASQQPVIASRQPVPSDAWSSRMTLFLAMHGDKKIAADVEFSHAANSQRIQWSLRPLVEGSAAPPYVVAAMFEIDHATRFIGYPIRPVPDQAAVGVVDVADFCRLASGERASIHVIMPDSESKDAHSGGGRPNESYWDRLAVAPHLREIFGEPTNVLHFVNMPPRFC